jgi:phosphatidylinositol glycan class V
MHPAAWLTLSRNVGFLRYWTLGNIPLFAIATPILAVMLQSSYWTFKLTLPMIVGTSAPVSEEKVDINTIPWTRSQSMLLIFRLNLPQVLIAILAITNYHVQIITRLASAYPVWYWWLALEIVDGSYKNSKWKPIRTYSRYFTVYAILQAGLFACFLPPA